jgi:hypothetical protein
MVTKRHHHSKRWRCTTSVGAAGSPPPVVGQYSFLHLQKHMLGWWNFGEKWFTATPPTCLVTIEKVEPFWKRPYASFYCCSHFLLSWNLSVALKFGRFTLLGRSSISFLICRHTKNYFILKNLSHDGFQKKMFFLFPFCIFCLLSSLGQNFFWWAQIQIQMALFKLNFKTQVLTWSFSIKGLLVKVYDNSWLMG